MATDTAASWRVLRLAARLPWNLCSDPLPERDVSRAVLDEAHVGGDQVKAELLGVARLVAFARERNARVRPPALLLAGPPGVGKTSVARAFASAIRRPLVKIDLAGATAVTLSGSSEQYTDSSPGAILRAIDNAGVHDPVLLLDEVDKLATSSWNGRCEDVLLGLLDGSDDGCFTDAFLGMSFDLTDVIWIATANTPGAISRPLVDRMRRIDLPPYSAAELCAIAARRLVPDLLAELRLRPGEVTFTDAALRLLVELAARDGGVRQLEAGLRQLLPAVIDELVSDGALVVDPGFVSAALRPDPSRQPDLTGGYL